MLLTVLVISDIVQPTEIVGDVKCFLFIFISKHASCALTNGKVTYSSWNADLDSLFIPTRCSIIWQKEVIIGLMNFLSGILEMFYCGDKRGFVSFLNYAIQKTYNTKELGLCATAEKYLVS